MIDYQPLGYAVLLLVAGLALLVLEFFIVSFGLLGAAAAGCAVAAVYFAFQLGPLAGYSFLFITLLLAALLLRWGLRRVQQSSAVPKAQIDGDAGYRHVAERLGVTAGTAGVMVTPARPTGRARFDGGECDVQTRGRSLERGALVIVEHIDGPTIFVKAAE